MVSCAAKLFRRTDRDETFGAKSRGISMYGKYGGEDWGAPGAAGNEIPGFAANPIGVEYDPEEILAKMRAGTPGSAFLRRQADLPVSPIRGALAH